MCVCVCVCASASAAAFTYVNGSSWLAGIGPVIWGAENNEWIEGNTIYPAAIVHTQKVDI